MKNLFYYLFIKAIVALSCLLVIVAMPVFANQPFTAIGVVLGIIVINNLACIAVHNNIRGHKASH